MYIHSESVSVYIYIYSSRCVCVSVCACLLPYVFVRLCIGVSARLCACACRRVRACVRVCVCVCVSMCSPADPMIYSKIKGSYTRRCSNDTLECLSPQLSRCRYCALTRRQNIPREGQHKQRGTNINARKQDIYDGLR